MVNIVNLTFKYLNKKINEEELLEKLNLLMKENSKDKKEISNIIKEVNNIISSDKSREELEEYILNNEYYKETAKSMTPLDVANMIGESFSSKKLPTIDQEFFNDMADSLIKEDNKGYLWRLALNYNNEFDMDKLETYFIDTKDTYYLTELISVLDEPNYYRIANKLIDTKDKEFVSEILDAEYISFPEYLLNTLEKFIRN